MLTLLLLSVLGAAPVQTAGGAIDATIRGTSQALDVELFLRDESEDWKEIAHKRLAAGVGQVRFDGLAPGVYQLRVRGAQPTELLATKIVVGSKDTRRTTITIEPFVLSGKVTLGGTDLGGGSIILRHREFKWSSGLAIAPDGTFTGPLWQRGAFRYSVRHPAMPTDYTESLEIAGAAKLAINVPDGRITGVVRDAASGAPVAGALVALQTTLADREENVQVTTGPEGRFDFTGMKYGRHTVRIAPPRHLRPEPVEFVLDANNRQRELDIRLDPGREIAILVIDRNNDPVAKATVFAVADARLRARTVTDEDGRASVPVPNGESAALFVVSEEGPFAMLRVHRDAVKGRQQVHLPATPSSLLIRAQTTDGETMPPFSLLMRFNGELVPAEVGEALGDIQGLRLASGANGEALLRNIPSGSYEFWPYRAEAEAESIAAAGAAFLAPIQVNVRAGENRIAVKFARR